MFFINYYVVLYKHLFKNIYILPYNAHSHFIKKNLCCLVIFTSDQYLIFFLFLKLKYIKYISMDSVLTNRLKCQIFDSHYNIYIRLPIWIHRQASFYFFKKILVKNDRRKKLILFYFDLFILKYYRGLMFNSFVRVFAKFKKSWSDFKLNNI